MNENNDKRDICKYQMVDPKSFELLIGMIGGKWKMRILFCLAHHEYLRYGELRRSIPPISHKMLSLQLKEMERDGIISRKEYPQIPPKVEYSLSPKGIDMIPIFSKMCDWILKHLQTE